MNAALAGLSAAAAIGGLFALVIGLIPREVAPARASRSGRLSHLWTRASRVQKLVAVLATAIAVTIFVFTGWVAALIIIPLGGIMLPALLIEPKNHDIELLEALDRWVRALTASLPTGKSLSDAIRSTMQQVPPLLAPAVQTLVARVHERWRLREALLAMADELGSADADAVIAALIIASDRGGQGAASTLTALSDNVQHRLVSAREIEAERAKPRIVVRQVTLITLAAISVALVLGRGYFEPFTTSLGQIIVLALTVAYLGSLWGLTRLSVPRARDRILTAREFELEVTHA